MRYKSKCLLVLNVVINKIVSSSHAQTSLASHIRVVFHGRYAELPPANHAGDIAGAGRGEIRLGQRDSPRH